MIYTRESSIRQLLKHPVARDVADKILHSTGKPRSFIYNPVTGCMRLAAADALAAQFGLGGTVDSILALVNRCDDTDVPDPGPETDKWWRGAVIYQIYPRSFQDSNGDGIGDLEGIRSRLDYLQALGVDALWLSPIFDSPQVDNGYDIRDYRAIDARFGSMEDFERLAGDMHSRGMKLILDMVFNHTSDQHQWFISSAGDPNSPYRDYYVWREGKRPPNNWKSFFGGPAWKYYPARGAWNLHLFAEGQPDLNWENPAVREEMYDIARFWRSKGADGFRLDAVNFISKADGLPDGREALSVVSSPIGVEHYFYGPRLHKYFKELRERGLGDAYAIGECGGLGRETGRLVTAPGRRELDQIFYFDHLDNPGCSRDDDYFFDLAHAKDFFTRLMTDDRGGLWDALFWENHDTPRMVSRINRNPSMRAPLSKLLNLWILTLRGTPYIYQGQELGLPNADFDSIGQIDDIGSRGLYAELSPKVGETAAFEAVCRSTRDHARVPMPWQPYGGFTTGTPWLKQDRAGIQKLCVDAQERDDQSVLNFTRQLILLRRANPALLRGDFTPAAAKRRDVFCFKRSYLGETLYVEMNITNVSCAAPARPERRGLLLGSCGGSMPYLRPYEANIYKLV